MRIRMHKGSYIDSMATTKTIGNNMSEVADYFTEQYCMDIKEELLKIEDYGVESKGNWGKTYIVLYDNLPLGFTNEMVV